MIRGVSRQMVEVTTVESPYFERAFFIVRPNAAEQPEDTLQREAGRVMHAQNGYSGLRQARRRHLWGQIGLLLLGGGLGIVLQALITIIL